MPALFIVRDRPSTWAGASSVDKILNGEARIFHDLVQNALSEVTFGMDRNSGALPVRMDKHRMAPGLTIQHKALLFQNGDDLAGGEGRKFRSHTATRTLWDPTSS